MARYVLLVHDAMTTEIDADVKQAPSDRM